MPAATMGHRGDLVAIGGRRTGQTDRKDKHRWTKTES
jgi:hypothetical protein